MRLTYIYALLILLGYQENGPLQNKDNLIVDFTVESEFVDHHKEINEI